MKVHFYTNIASHYRRSIWKLLLQEKHIHFQIFFGENRKIGIKTIDFEKNVFKNQISKLSFLKNIWFRGNILVWQRGVIRNCLVKKFDKAIFLGEMYCISTWIAAIICRIRGIETIFWGHGLYGNEGEIKLLIRRVFYKLAHKHLLYEKRAKQLMISNMFKAKNIFVLYNSLDYEQHKYLRDKVKDQSKSDVFPFFKNPELPTLIFIGRLTSIKKLDILISVTNRLNKKSFNINLLIIGDGPERLALEELAKMGTENGLIHFTGAIYDELKTTSFLYAADICISPGNVGLTAIHSLSMGTPVGTHGNLSHQMPEAGAIIDGFNGFYFEENNIDDLQSNILNWMQSNPKKEVIRPKCYKIIDKYYNPYYQLKVIKDLLAGLRPNE